MLSKKLLALCALALTHTAASAWFFFIPGPLISAITDKAQGVDGDHCVSASAKVGDRISVPGGRMGTVRTLSGTSSRCTNGSIPIRARLDVDDWSAIAAGQQQTLCIPHGLRPGDRYTDLTLGIVIIRELSVTATQCMDAKMPVQAIVVSAVAPASVPDVPAPLVSPTVPAVATPESEIYRCTIWVSVGSSLFEAGRGWGTVKSLVESVPECPSTTPHRALVVFNTFPATTHEIQKAAAQRVPQTSTAVPEDTVSAPAHRLRALKKLLVDGLITQDDFNAKKKEILSAM